MNTHTKRKQASKQFLVKKHAHPELRDFLLNLGCISAAREESLCLLAEHDGKPGAAGVPWIHDGVALFASSAFSALGVWSATRK
jgi:hypothetical protein